jgi:hypothetical protein
VAVSIPAGAYVAWRLEAGIEYERIVGRVRCTLEADIVEAAWANGRMMTLEQAMAYALGETAAQAWNV